MAPALLMLISKEFSFDAAHFLTKYEGKCERLHGHTYRLRVTVEGPVGEDGLVMDFVLLKKLVKERVIDVFDHQCLNDFFENPSTEVVVLDVWKKLVDLNGVKLYEVSLWETPDSFVTYRGD